jgi:indole-3-glycerol phosphate synthase
MSAAPDLLLAIVAATRHIVETRRAQVPLDRLAARAVERPPKGTDFEAALRRRDRINVIAECKRRSPSKGVLTANYEPAKIASAYESGGAAAISVLTEPTFFDGSLDHLTAVRSAVSVPLLRKDFIVDEYQLHEARLHGADAILLIVAALEQTALVTLAGQAGRLGLAALVEVHNEEELARAVDAGARLIGVNNRNLRTLEVDVEASHRLARLIPRAAVAISESGLRSRSELDRLQSEGYGAFLIGERFMTDADPARAVADLIGVLA